MFNHTKFNSYVEDQTIKSHFIQSEFTSELNLKL